MDAAGTDASASLVEPQQNAGAAKSTARRCFVVLGVILLGDIVAVPVMWLLPYSFDVSACWQEQVTDWSFTSSLADWVLLSLVRDVCMLLLLLLGGRSQQNGTGSVQRSAQPLRRMAGFVIFVGCWRYANVEWSQDGIVSGASANLLPVGIFSGGMALLALLCAHLFRTSQDRADKAEADLMASMAIFDGETGAPKEEGEEMYKSSMDLFGLVKVMKPYFWPSSGKPSENLRNRALAMLTWVCVIGSKTSNVIAPLYLQSATNAVAKALNGGEEVLTGDIVKHLFSYALLGLLSKSLKELQSLIYIPVARTAYIEIADNSFNHLHTLSLDWHLKKKQGGVIRSMQRGLQAAQQTMQYIFLYLVPTIAEAIAVCLVFFFHFNNVKLAVFVGLNLFVYVYITVKLTIWRKKFREGMAKKDNEMNDRLSDSLTNFETIKYFTAENYEAGEYKKAVTQFQQGNMMTQASMNFLNVLQQGVIYFTLFGGLVQSTQILLQEHRDLGEFVAVNTYIVNVFGPLSFLGTIYNMAVNALIDMYSFGQLLAETSDVQDVRGAPSLNLATTDAPMVEFRDVCFGYRGMPNARSLKEISFSIQRGNMMALVGTTGAGKTTITRLLFRFYDPVSGTVSINGQCLRSVSQKTVRAAIGMVPQDVVMFNDSIRHNIHYGKVGEATQADIERAAESSQLTEFISQQEKGYETPVGERGLKLSGGEKQRLAIARCLVKNPPIVILDEATSALDSQTEQRVQQALSVLSESRTVIAIAHRLSTIKNYDEILVLESGQIRERGAHDDLLKKDGGKYSAMWHRQIQGLSMDGSLEPNIASGLELAY